MPIKLHFSLHSPIDKDRYNLIPGTKVSVEEALAYLLHYRDIVTKNMVIMNNYKLFHRTDEPIEIHYTLIKGVNDSEEQLEELKRLLSYYKIPIKFIRFNPINELEISDSEKYWVNELSKIPNLRVKTYSPPGREIGSSCGEFTKHYYLADIETEEELKEFEEWKRKHEIFERGREDYLNDNESLTTLAKLETIDSIPTEKVKMLGSNHSPVIK
jgi:adenine C2-methylase RlmN of 23S rRNA A2503 and tRNA A37